MSGVELWSLFVAAAVHDVEVLAAAEGKLDKETAAGLGHVAFRLGMSSVLVGAEEVGRLALACERALDGVAGGLLEEKGIAALKSGLATLRAAVDQLAHPDKSGARVEGLPIDERSAAIEELVADLAVAAKPSVVAPAARSGPTKVVVEAAPAPAGAYTWVPTVDDDMIDLFFDEAGERLEDLAGKLVEIERRPGDEDLVRDVFRDLHTVKGSSAMVGLGPVNQLAHAAEDLVGQVRDAGRAVDGPVVDALLSALDALRAMLQQARARQPVTVDPGPVVTRLRNPTSGGIAVPAAPLVAMPPGESKGASAAEVSGAHAAATAAAKATIRVDFDKLDRLLNLVGELVLGRDDLRAAITSLSSVAGELASDRAIARRVSGARVAVGDGGVVPLRQGLAHLTDDLSRIERVLGDVSGELDHGADRLDAISSELREQVMRLRMVPIGGIFKKHVRTVRDLAATLNKRARLELVGEDTELDKLLVEALDEPLMHLVRNSVDHGVEMPDVRVAAGKPAEGVVKLSASHRGNQVEIRISDDGKGMDPAKLRAKAVEKGLMTADEAEALEDRAALDIIFRAGFSTAATISHVSGRGVGMDVVRTTIVTRLKGTIDVESTPGHGSAFVLKLPLTLAIIQVLLARAGGETFAIPLDSVLRVLVIAPGEVRMVGEREVVEVRGRHVPLIRLEDVLELDDHGEADQLHIVFTEQSGVTYGLVCDHLLGKKEIVIKSMGPLLAGVPCVAGATLLGDRCALILDVAAVIRRALEAPAGAPRRAAGDRSGRARAGAAASQVLLVEDSDIVRESLRRLLADAGYLVTTAVDGQHGLELARSRQFDLVSTDVMMPRMDGYELTRALRATPQYANIPIVMVTSRGERIDRVRGFDAGVDEYITKPHDRQLLLRAVKKLLGHGAGEADDGPPPGGSETP
ncbi:MAG TPA: response regulator [Kofleriaceae bacterium]|nr:response regulator [Kofleriaceae bacterium]